ncbi:MAG: hypothetical protein M1825_001934 [Sarcosagium campestre]|nr:MAG: hypothetical protein M1825_001934 [Sarcosagium campestre]
MDPHHSPRYQPLEKTAAYRDSASSSECAESLDGLLEGGRVEVPARVTRWSLFCRVFPWTFHALLLTLAVGLLSLAETRDHAARRSCVERNSVYSPALEAVQEYHEVQFNGTLDHPSPYRGTPTDELDAAWANLTNGMGAFTVDDETMRKIGHSDISVRVPEKYGGGFMASLETFHQLHCVNLIRQYTYKEYYQDRSSSFKDPPELLRTHVDHCLEMLRQKLMCDADVGVITYNWVEIRDQPWPDFNTKHKCRNFDAVFDWGVKNQAKFSGEEITKTAGIVALATPP